MSACVALRLREYNFMTTGQMPSANEDYMIRLKAPQLQRNGLCGEAAYSLLLNKLHLICTDDN